jgi:hypothetical protein
MTKKKAGAWLMILLIIALMPITSKSFQGDPSIEAFWSQFKAAVIKSDKIAVARLSQFPIEMPYGMGSVRNAAQLSRRYREVFNGEANAAKCFAESKPEVDPQNAKRFTVGCKIQNTGDVVIIYGFGRTKAGWKFDSLDNINE